MKRTGTHTAAASRPGGILMPSAGVMLTSLTPSSCSDLPVCILTMVASV